MIVPDEVVSVVEQHVGSRILNTEPVGGGCIAHAARVDTDSGRFFLKWGPGESAATFPAEAAGLRALREAESGLIIPEPRLVYPPDSDGSGLLLMDWIEPGRRVRRFWEHLGEGLAALHRHATDRYGFDTDNFIGRMPQRNEWSDSWPAFFAAARLEPQVQRAQDAGRWQDSWTRHLNYVLSHLDQLLPEQPTASILHGDLWKGNVLAREDESAALIDPAVYYGHREADLAMTELFGGFDKTFYAAYRAAWPIEAGYAERREVYNLYHLINHLNHFGGGYGDSVERVLKQF